MWAAEIWWLWRKAGFPTLVGGVAPEQARLAKAILGLEPNNVICATQKTFKKTRGKT